MDACDVRASTSLPCRAAEQRRSRSLLCFVRALRLSLCLSVSLSACLVLSPLLLSWPWGGMFQCSHVRLFSLRLLILMMTHAFACAPHFVAVRRRRLLIGLCCYSSSLFVLLLVLLLLLSFYSSCPLVPSAPCRTLLFNIFVPLVLNFSTFCASFSLCPFLFLSLFLSFFFSHLLLLLLVLRAR